ncbi:MAG: glycosyltransferase family 39 protein [Patescibacteria group bacterium]
MKLFKRLAAVSDTQIFIACFCVAITLSILAFPHTLVGGDEGRYVLDAMRFGRGEIPVADWSTRTPILLALIFVFTKILGASLFVFRLPILILSALSAGALFLLGKELFNKKIGLLASMLFAFNPYTLWAGQIIKSEIMTIFFSILSVLFLVRGLRLEKNYLIFLSGLLIGLGFIERLSILAMCVVATSVIIICTRSAKKAFSRVFIFGVGGLIGFLPIFLWISYHNFSRAFDLWFGFAVQIISEERRGYSPNAAPTYDTYQLLRAWALAFVEDLAVEGWALFSGFVVFLLGAVQVFISDKKHTVRLLILLAIVGTFSGALIGHAGLIYHKGFFRPYVFLFMAIFSIALILLFIHLVIIKNLFTDNFKNFKKEIAAILIWIASYIIAYTFWRPGYIREFIPPMTLGVALVFYSLPWGQCKSRTASFTVIIGLVCGLYGTSVAWYADPRTGGWWWTHETINDAASFIHDHTKDDEKVFTANALPVVIAKRRVFSDLNSYSMLFAVTDNDHWASFPSPNEVLAELHKNPPSYVIVDNRMKRDLYKPHPAFEKFVAENYRQVISYGSGLGKTDIWEKKSEL